MPHTPEPWLRGPVPDVDPYLMPAAHALLQAAEDLNHWASPLTVDELWASPNGAPPVGFHLRHIAGSIDRLLTYSRGDALTPSQLATLAAEREPGDPPGDAAALVAGAQRAITGALAVLRATPRETLLEPRSVGRAALPSTVLGLLVHIAEHTQRHVGQVVTTSRVVRAR